MRQPIWIFNSALFLLLMLSVALVYFLYIPIPVREEIEPDGIVSIAKKTSIKINISQIYQNDLFGTQPIRIDNRQEQISIKPVPSPPHPEEPFIPEVPKPQFLEPINIELKGTIVVGYDESKNTAIVLDKKTSEEKAYYLEDMIEDSHIIKIMNNKVILLRSNGQQEVIYLREYDAKNDPTYIVATGWEGVVLRKNKSSFEVKVGKFLDRVQNLAQFIDLLDLTTVYQKGKSVGCRVGKLEPQSLGIALGLLRGDIIMSINGIPAVDTPSRFKIYQKIIHMKKDSMVNVELLRADKKINIEYQLNQFNQDDDNQLNVKENGKKEEIYKKPKLAPTLEQLREKEQNNGKLFDQKAIEIEK